MPIQDIYLGTAPNNGTGDDARTGGSIINANFALVVERLEFLESQVHEVEIDGAYVMTDGKTNLSLLEVNDKFRMWVNDRYVVGKIISLPVALPSDIDNSSKVKLAVNSEI